MTEIEAFFFAWMGGLLPGIGFGILWQMGREEK